MCLSDGIKSSVERKSTCFDASSIIDSPAALQTKATRTRSACMLALGLYSLMSKIQQQCRGDAETCNIFRFAASKSTPFAIQR
jgi:hypothetical protein